MKWMYFGLLAVSVLISVPYLLPADASLELKQVPFWFHTDPETGEEVYTDYFNEVSSVAREHTAYLDSIAKGQTPSIFNPSIMLEVERSGMVEEITYEYQYIQVRDSAFDHGPFANPDYTIRELVAISTWVEAPVPVVVEEITEDVTEITPSSVTDITTIIESIVPEITVVEVTVEPQREASGRANTHWDQEEQHLKGHSEMSSQELKDMKKKHAEWKAYELASKLYPTLYPAYVHHEEVVEVVEEEVIVVPIYESEVISDEIMVPIQEPTPVVRSSEVVVPVQPEPIVEPTPVPSVTSSTVVVPVPETTPQAQPGVSSSVVVPAPEVETIPTLPNIEIINGTVVVVEEN